MKEEVGKIHLDFLPTARLNKIDAILQVTGAFKEQNFPVKTAELKT